MKKIIHGKLYDTETAERLADYESRRSVNDLYYVEESLFRKKNGELFFAGHGGAGSRYGVPVDDCTREPGEGIIPITGEEAKMWTEETQTADVYISIFGEVEE